MAKLEDLTEGALLRGVLGDRAVKIVGVEWHGPSAITLTFTEESTRKPAEDLPSRDDEARLTIEQGGRTWPMDASSGRIGPADAFRIGFAS